MKKIFLLSLFAVSIFLLGSNNVQAAYTSSDYETYVDEVIWRPLFSKDHKYKIYKEDNNKTYFYYRDPGSMLSEWILKPSSGEIGFQYVEMESQTFEYSVKVANSVSVKYEEIGAETSVEESMTMSYTVEQTRAYDFTVKSTDKGVEHAIAGVIKMNSYRVKIYENDWSLFGGDSWIYKGNEYFEAPFGKVVARLYKNSSDNGAPVYFF